MLLPSLGMRGESVLLPNRLATKTALHQIFGKLTIFTSKFGSTLEFEGTAAYRQKTVLKTQAFYQG